MVLAGWFVHVTYSGGKRQLSHPRVRVGGSFYSSDESERTVDFYSSPNSFLIKCLHLAMWEMIIDMLDRQWCSGLPKYLICPENKALMFSLCNHMQSHAILKREKYLAYIRQIGITQAFSMCFSECLGDWATEHSDVVYYLTMAGFPQTLSRMLVEGKIYLISDKKINDSFLKSISLTQVLKCVFLFQVSRNENCSFFKRCSFVILCRRKTVIHGWTWGWVKDIYIFGWTIALKE